MSESIASTPAACAIDTRSGPSRLYPNVFWLIRLRWIAVVGVIIALITAVYLKVIEMGLPILVIAVWMAAFNLYLWWRVRRERKRGMESADGRWVITQLLFDMVSLTALLHFAGGAENPFAMFYAFHVAIGAVFLPRRTVWLIGLIAALLQTGLVLGEFYEIFPHYSLTFTQPPDLPPHPHRTPHDMHMMPEFILSYLIAFILMLAGVIYLVQTVAERQRLADALRQEHERIALSRERMARIGEISTGLAHTIRNPLHGVINASEILQKKLATNDSTVHDMFDLMDDGLGRIERVTSRLLTLTRDSPLKLVNTQVHLLVQETLRFVEARARKENIRLSVEVNTIPPMTLDPDRLFEVLINLLDNALAACREGDAITVKTAWCLAPRSGVCIWIEDTGVGISPDNLSRVFDPFFTTKPLGEGSGLGLAIAKRIVEEHEGELSIESVVGEGTTMSIFLPQETAATSAGRARHERTAPSAGGR